MAKATDLEQALDMFRRIGIFPGQDIVENCIDAAIKTVKTVQVQGRPLSQQARDMEAAVKKKEKALEGATRKLARLEEQKADLDKSISDAQREVGGLQTDLERTRAELRALPVATVDISDLLLEQVVPAAAAASDPVLAAAAVAELAALHERFRGLQQAASALVARLAQVRPPPAPAADAPRCEEVHDPPEAPASDQEAVFKDILARAQKDGMSGASSIEQLLAWFAKAAQEPPAKKAKAEDTMVPEDPDDFMGSSGAAGSAEPRG